jgi:hypothetical protein
MAENFWPQRQLTMIGIFLTCDKRFTSKEPPARDHQLVYAVSIKPPPARFAPATGSPVF